MKPRVGDVLWMALDYAICDRKAFIEALHGSDPEELKMTKEKSGWRLNCDD